MTIQRRREEQSKGNGKSKGGLDPALSFEL
jgi:hypothetical protein